jgi:hypothetical protein
MQTIETHKCSKCDYVDKDVMCMYPDKKTPDPNNVIRWFPCGCVEIVKDGSIQGTFSYYTP